MKWQQQQEKGNAFVLHLTLWLYRFLGQHVLKQLIVPIVIFWYWLFAHDARRASKDYLSKIQPYLQDGSKPTLSTYQHFRHYGLALVDKFAGWLGDVNETHLTLHGHEHFRQHYGKGAIVLTSHFGNIELLRAIKSNHAQIVNVLVYTKHAAQFNRVLQHINPAALVRLISVDDLGVDTAIFLQERLDAGEWLLIAADRTPIQSERIEMLPFLGHQSAWPQGAWVLASLLKCPVLSVFCYAQQEQHHVHIHLMTEKMDAPRRERSAYLRQLMLQYCQLMEHHCSIAPYQWFNFYPFWNTASEMEKEKVKTCPKPKN